MTQFLSPTTTTSTTYSSAFPPLQAFPWTFHKQPSFHHASPTSSVPSTPSTPLNFFTALAPPKYPAYLKQTSYANLVTDQYHHLQQKKKNNNDEYNKDLVEIDLRLPQYWNINDKSRHLQIGLNGYDLTFHANIPGPGKKEHTEAASIRTNFPMRPQCGIYYYEMNVISMGNDGLFAIGFCNSTHTLDKLPGNSQGSFGYHGQNGQIYKKNSKGKSYGPSFASGDVIGCGINFFNNTAFYTKNGVSLGCAFDSIDASSDLLYPCIGLSTQDEKISANFGQGEFAFDIEQYIKDQQRMLVSQVCDVHVEESPQNKYKNDTKSQIDEMVLSYLIHQGYIGTVSAMKKNIEYVGNMKQVIPISNNDNIDQDTRSSIRKSLMTGHVDMAIEKTETMYPNLLDNNPDLLFQLKTRKYLDILIDDCHEQSSIQLHCPSDVNNSDTDDDTMSVQSGRSRTLSFSSNDLQHQVLYEEQPVTFGHYNAPLVSPLLPVVASGRRLSWAAIAASPSSDSHLEEPQHINGRRRRLSSVSNHGRRSSHSSLFLNEEDENPKTMTTARRAMHYGQQLQEEYQHTKYWSQLMELFTLLSFADPKSSPMGHLLDTSRRDLDASDLNNAIQAYQHHAIKSNLELVFKQAIVTSKELALSGQGKSSLMHIQNHFMSN